MLYIGGRGKGAVELRRITPRRVQVATHVGVVVDEGREPGLTQPDVVTVVVLGAGSDPVQRVVVDRVHRHHVPLHHDLTVACYMSVCPSVCLSDGNDLLLWKNGLLDRDAV